MFGKILVPLDGSTLAERALPYARALAAATGARLRLVRSSSVPARPDPGTLEARACAAEEAYLSGFTRDLAAAGSWRRPACGTTRRRGRSSTKPSCTMST